MVAKSYVGPTRPSSRELRWNAPGTVFRDAGKYAAQYGGKASDYVKVTSDVFKSGGKTQFSVHVVMNTVTGAIHDAKTVLGR